MRFCSIIIFFISLAYICLAAEIKGVSLPDQIQISTQNLTLNGMAIKKVSIFRISVYLVGLYLEQPAHSADFILGSQQIKVAKLKFLRKVKAKKLAKGWVRDLRKSCQNNCEALLNEAIRLGDKLKQLPPVEKYQTVSFIMLPQRVEVQIENKTIGYLYEPNAPMEVLSVFIGPNVRDLPIKAALLGEASK